MGSGIVTALTSINEDKRSPQIIYVPSDFPTKAQADSKAGKLYIAGADVIDNDPAKTNTGQHFKNGDVFYWDRVAQQYTLITTNTDFYAHIGTSRIYGGNITVNTGDNTKFDVSAGYGFFADSYTNPEGPPIITPISWDAFIGVATPYLSVSPATFVAINKSTGGLFLYPLQLTPEQQKDYMLLGIAIHQNFTFINDAKAYGVFYFDWSDLISRIYYAFKSICFGLNFMANGSNLKLDLLEGDSVSIGLNYFNNPKNPNIAHFDTQYAVTFNYADRTTIYGFTDTVPVMYYDKNGTLTEIPDNYYTTHRLLFDPVSGAVGFQYGQSVYDSLKKAVLAGEKEDYIYHPLAAIMSLRSILAVKKNANDLTNLDQARFVQLNLINDTALNKVDQFANFADNIEIIDGMSYQRQAISFINVSGTLYADIAAVYYFISDDIYFTASDKSINTSTLDFTTGNLYAGDKLEIKYSTNNSGIFTVATIAQYKITVTETIIDESAGPEIKIETPGKGDITYIFGQREFILDCTTGSGIGGRARIALTNGTDTAPQENWTYVIRSGESAILQNALTEPSGEYGVICSSLIPSVSTAASEGFYNSRRWSDAKEVEGRGATATILSRLRDLSPFKSGAAATVTIDTGPNPDSVDLSIAAGVFREIYLQQTYPLQISIQGALVVNDPVTPYRHVTDLNEIDYDSAGATLVNKYYQLIVILSLNTDGMFDRILINLPNGSYINGSDAFNDTQNYSVTTLPNTFRTAYLICAAVLKNQGGSTFINVAESFGVNNIDLRGQPLGSSSGGSGTSAVTQFSDAVFRIFNTADDTKKIAFDASQIATATTRIITMCNRNINLDTPQFTSVATDTITEFTVNNGIDIEGLHYQDDYINKSGTLLQGITFDSSDNATFTENLSVSGDLQVSGGGSTFFDDLNILGQLKTAKASVGTITDLTNIIFRINSPSDYGETLDQEFANKDATSSETQPYQTYTAGITGYLSSVSIHNGSGGIITGVTVNVYSGAGVGGPLIAQEAGIMCTNNAFTKVQITDLPLNILNSVYTIEVVSTGDQFYWNINTAGGYPGGTFIVAGQDALFRTYIASGFNVVFDHINNRFGIGTIAPQYVLDLQGDIATNVPAVIRGDATNLGTNWIATTKPTMALLCADANLNLVSDGGGGVGSAIVFDEVNSTTQTYVDHWSLWRQTNSSGSSFVGYYGTSPGVGGTKIFEFGSAGRCWITALSGNATYAYMRYDTATDELFYNTSAKKYKTNIDYSTSDILNRSKNLIDNLKIAQFDMIDGSIQNKIGIIAEDLAQIESTLCYKNENNEIEGYNDGDLVPFIIKYLQYLTDIINNITN